MRESEFELLAGMLAKIAYKVHDNPGIDAELRGMLLDLWREFDHFNHLNDYVKED